MIIITIIMDIRAEENSSCSLNRHHQLVQGQNTSDVGHLLLACDWGRDLKRQIRMNKENLEYIRFKHINVKVIKNMFLIFGTPKSPCTPPPRPQTGPCMSLVSLSQSRNSCSNKFNSNNNNKIQQEECCVYLKIINVGRGLKKNLL